MSSSLDIEYLLQVADAPELYTRTKLAIQLAEFIEDPDSGADEREALLPVLLRLCEDESGIVRRSLHERIKQSKRVPVDVPVAFVADDEELACEILRVSPVLDDNILIGIAGLADQARLLAICERPKLSARLSRALVDYGDSEVTRAVLANRGSTVDEGTYALINMRHGPLVRYEDELLKRRDVPALLAVSMVDAVSDRLMRHASNSNWLKPDRAALVVAEAKEEGLVQILRRADLTGDRAIVHDLAAKGRITPTLIMRAALSGNMVFVEEALAIKSGMPATIVASMMTARRAVGFRALYVKTRMADRFYLALRVALDVNREFAKRGAKTQSSAFGRRIVEKVLTGYEEISDQDRRLMLALFRKYGCPKTRKLVDQVVGGLSAAA